MIPPNITFWRTPLQTKLLLAKIKQDDTLKEIFKKKTYVTDDVNNDINHRLNGILESFFCAFITGAQGTMKSTLQQTLAKRFDPTFTAARISFDYDLMEQNINNSQPKQIFVQDEQLFKHGEGSRRLIQNVQNLVETLRKRQNSMLFASPDNKQFPEKIFTYVLETIDSCLLAICPNNQELHEPRACVCYDNHTAEIKQAYVRSALRQEEIYVGFYVCEIEWGNEIWNEYNLKKDEFMEKIKSNQIHNMDYKAMARQVMADPKFMDYSKSKKSLALLVEQRKPNLTLGEREMIIEQVRVFQRQKEMEEM
jgi:hypothetical protein